MREERRSRSMTVMVATYAFDDEPTLTSAKGDWNQHGDVGIQRGVGGGSTDAFVVSTNGVSNTVMGTR